jgi:hypothetical protein
LPRGSLLLVAGPLWLQAGKEFNAAHTHEHPDDLENPNEAAIAIRCKQSLSKLYNMNWPMAVALEPQTPQIRC